MLSSMPNSMHHTPHEKAKAPGMPARPAPPPDTYVATCLFGEYENAERYERVLTSLIPMLHFAHDFACYSFAVVNTSRCVKETATVLMTACERMS